MIKFINFYWKLKRKEHFFIGIGLSLLFTMGALSFNTKIIVQNLYTLINVFIPIGIIQFLLSVIAFMSLKKLNLPIIEVLKQRKIIKDARETEFYQIDQLYGYFGWSFLIQAIFLAYIGFICFIKSKISLILLLLFGKWFLSIFFVFGVFYVEILFVHNFYLLYKMVIWKNS